MLHSVQDLIDIDSRIEQVNLKRNELSNTLKRLKHEDDDYICDMDRIDMELNEASDAISNIKNINDVNALRSKYGKLTILNQVELLLKEKQKESLEKKIAEEISSLDVNDFQDVEIINFDKLESIHKEITATNEISLSLKDQFNSFLQKVSEGLSIQFKQDLLESKWDTEYFLNSKKSVYSLRRKSSVLFNLQKLYFNNSSNEGAFDNPQYWNFQCISHNFLIKYMYHFSNPSLKDSDQHIQTIELYFKFLDKYLDSNLFRCIELFNDEGSGLQKEFVHEQFINHTLNPIRTKVTQTLERIIENQTNENVRTMIILISQIFKNDNALIQKHYYTGVGLVSLLPSYMLESWVAFEADSTLHQYEIISSSPLETNATDLTKLLDNMFQYFEPFFNINYDYLNSYKLQVLSKIFLEVVNKYNKFIVSPDPSLTQMPEEKQLEITFMKLHNVLLIDHCLFDLQFKPAFIELTYVFNKLSGSSYTSVFSESAISIKETLITVRDSILHRWKKALKSALASYFRLNSWNDLSADPTQCSTELIIAIQKTTQLKSKFMNLGLPPSVTTYVLHGLLSQWILYLKDYVVKINTFSKNGLKQVMYDFEDLKQVLTSADSVLSVEEMEFKEYMRVLDLKYNDESRSLLPFLSKSYISTSVDYLEVRDALNLKYMSNSELDYALYKIL